LPNKGEPLNVLTRLNLEEKLSDSGLKAKHKKIDELELKIVLDTVAFQRQLLDLWFGASSPS